jgi:hypothetical protein
VKFEKSFVRERFEADEFERFKVHVGQAVWLPLITAAALLRASK